MLYSIFWLFFSLRLIRSFIFYCLLIEHLHFTIWNRCNEKKIATTSTWLCSICYTFSHISHSCMQCFSPKTHFKYSSISYMTIFYSFIAMQFTWISCPFYNFVLIHSISIKRLLERKNRNQTIMNDIPRNLMKILQKQTKFQFSDNRFFFEIVVAAGNSPISREKNTANWTNQIKSLMKLVPIYHVIVKIHLQPRIHHIYTVAYRNMYSYVRRHFARSICIVRTVHYSRRFCTNHIQCIFSFSDTLSACIARI